ncbi:MAG TPA: putative sulfate exporter family transporter [Anaerolineales bacterium]|nr:putative sulfate exporter family transporter [Anaerolineales bacterium]
MPTSFKNIWQSLRDELNQAWLGLVLVLGVAIASRFIHGLISHPTLSKSVSEILVAVLLGLILRNWLRLGARTKAGVKFAIQRILRLGIILLGLRLSLQDVAATGLTALALVTICITAALLMAYLAGRLFHVPPRLAALIGVGTAICGNTAIIATAPVLDADEEEMSFAVATITLFGLLAVLIYPLIGRQMGLSDHAFGLWAGTAVNDTSQVVAVGAIFSQAALDVATVVKLTRNTLMAPLIVLMGVIYSHGLHRTMSSKAVAAARLDWRKFIPGFVIGFLLMSLLRTVGVAIGVLPQDIANPGNLQNAADILKALDGVSKFAILMALAAVGLNTDLASLRRIGLKPLIIGTCVAVLLALLSLSLILFTPLGS